MGHWEKGLYDGDPQLDTLDELTETLDITEKPALVAGIVGLLARIAPVTLAVRLDEEEGGRDWSELLLNPPESAALSEAARSTLKLIAESPEEILEQRPGARSPQHAKILGDYCDGPHFKELLEAPGADTVIASFAETVMTRLDAMPLDEDLYFHCGELAPLGFLLELDVRVAEERINEWSRRFEILNASTDQQRDFWDEFSSNVHGALDLLRARRISS